MVSYIMKVREIRLPSLGHEIEIILQNEGSIGRPHGKLPFCKPSKSYERSLERSYIMLILKQRGTEQVWDTSQPSSFLPEVV